MTKYNPRVVTAPGESLLDVLEERGISHDDFAAQLGVTGEFLAELFEGKAAITSEIAQRLEEVLDTPAHFWLKREERYREYLRQKSPV